MMATQSSLQDCYFYFYSSCTKGDECPFRHCELALGTETVCSLWREGRCFRSNCKFRHMESRINRKSIPCYWENQPGGCRKPHCVFLHRKLRNGGQVVADAPGLILPTSDGKSSPDLNEASGLSTKAEKAVEGDVAPDPSLDPVPPLVLSFDEGEESDTESVTSTPVKQGDKIATLARNSPSVKASGSIEEKDFGIKTLEQIRMEKIHKESDSYYGAAYASTPLDAPRLIDQHYPPKSEFLALPKDSSLDKSSPASTVEQKLSGADEETDLRGRLSNKRISSSNKVNQMKRLVNFKKQNANQVEVVPKKLDFKIKTLEEIRREKENKQNAPPSLEEKPANDTKGKTTKKLKINRKPRELPAVLKPDSSKLNQAGISSNTILISNGMTKEMPTSSLEPHESPILYKHSSDSPGKRKSDGDSSPTASKIMKIVTIANGNQEQINGIHASSHENLQHPSASNEVPTASTHNQISTSVRLQQDETTDIQMTSSKSSHIPDEKTVHKSSVNDETHNPTTENVIMKQERSDSNCDNEARKKEDNFIDRSMSVDEDFDEFLGGDDMNMEEMDATPNDDILLQIEEFLES